jgi:anaerobic selenocysteine-containing dehydrogenase
VPAAIIQGRPYSVKALIVDGANPVLTWPDTAEVREALARLDLLVVIDLFMTETAKLAHVFLPAATFVEGQVFPDYFTTHGLPLVALGEQVIAPRGNSLPDWRIWVELGRRMGYGDYFPWRNDEGLFEYLLQPSGITLTQLKRHRGGIVGTSIEKQKYFKEGFNTPSGKVEIYSETMAAHGHPPLPMFELPVDSPLSQPDVTEKYPLIMTTGARVEAFTHSQYRNVALLHRHCPEPVVEINAQTAKSLGILDGNMVILETPKGSIELKARFSEDIHPLVLSIQHGWSEANANVLIDNHRDPISGFPNLRSVPCRVWRKDRR